MVDLILISCFFQFLCIFIGNWSFGASQSGDSVTSIPAGNFLLLLMSLLWKIFMLYIFNDFSGWAGVPVTPEKPWKSKIFQWFWGSLGGPLFEASGALGGPGTRLWETRFWKSFVTGAGDLFDARWSRKVTQNGARGVTFRCSSSVVWKPWYRW